MKILITGSTGLLGQALSRHLGRIADVIGLSRHTLSTLRGTRHVACDLAEARPTTDTIRALTPDVVIHTQALSDVDQCERAPEQARAQNVHTVTNVVEALKGSRTLLVHVSTDYVFDGAKGTPYVETDTPHPISVYGRSKLEGEQAALNYSQAVVVRPSTLFGAGRMNFCDHIVMRLHEGQIIEAFQDQTTSPTYTEDLAAGIAEVVCALRASSTSVSLPSRILHIANSGRCTRVQFAHQVADLVGGSRDLIRAVRIAEQHRPAPRPAYSALETLYLPQIIGRTLRPWDDALRAYLRQRHWLN